MVRRNSILTFLFYLGVETYFNGCHKWTIFILTSFLNNLILDSFHSYNYMFLYIIR